MILCHKDLKMFEYRSKEIDLFCFSFRDLYTQLKEIYNINAYVCLN